MPVTPKRVIAFDSSPEYRGIISCLLEQRRSYELTLCDSFEGLAANATRGPADLLIVEYGATAGGENGVSRLRQTSTTPILALVQSRDEAKAALRGGADYDLSKPFDPEVFLIAVAAVLRRGSQTASLGGLLPARGALEIDELHVFPDHRSVERGGHRLTLSPTEWALFAFLLANPGRVYSRRELAAGAWGPGYAGRGAQAELYISRVRKKVERDPRHPSLIATVRGRGYRLDPTPARSRG